MKASMANYRQCVRLAILAAGLFVQLLAHAQPGGIESPAGSDPAIDLAAVDWMHGAPNCERARAAPGYLEWQQVRYAANTYIFRQNKCANYEGPFVYLFVGSEGGLLIDTGATEEGGPALLETVRGITRLPITVAHSHGHGDHRAGDEAFRQADGFTLVEVGQEAVREFFGFSNWPRGSVTLDLGGREIEILAIPGHSDDDLAYYDPESRLIITGDSLYPGRLYVRDWLQYRDSIGSLAAWVEDKAISHVLGTHIEMSSTPNQDYPIGTTYQPQEHQLPLEVADIFRLRDAMVEIDQPTRIPLGSFIIWPL